MTHRPRLRQVAAMITGYAAGQQKGGASERQTFGASVHTVPMLSASPMPSRAFPEGGVRISRLDTPQRNGMVHMGVRS